jgi:hypothetical protein
MANTQDKQDPRGIFALFKGPSGAGKSVGALSFPGIYVFDLDHKMPAIALKHFPKKSIEYDTYDDIDPIADKIQGWINNNDCPYETLIIDSITSLVRIIMNSIALAKGESTPQMLKTIKATRSGAKMPELLGYDYYNAEVRFIDWILGNLKILWARPENPKNIIFVAHIVEVKTKPNINTGLITVTRSIMTLGNKAPAIIPSEFDEVYMFGTRAVGGISINDPIKIQRIMKTETCGEDDAKTAYKLASETDFTNANLYEKLQAQIAGAKIME